MNSTRTILGIVVLLSIMAYAADPPKIFISGVDRGAFDARKQAAKAKCFTLVTKPSDAHATLAVTETEHYGVNMRSRRNWRIEKSNAAAVLTLSDDSIVWQGASMWGVGDIVKTLDRDLCRGKLVLP